MFQLKDYWSDWLPASDRISAITILQLTPLARAYLAGYKLSMLSTCFVSPVFLIWIDWPIVAVWLSCVVITQFLVIHTTKAFLRELDTDHALATHNAKNWTYRFVGSAALFNIAGGSSLILFWVQDVPGNNYFLLFVAAASLAPSILVNFTHLPSALASLTFITGFAILALALDASPVNLVLIAGFFVYAFSLAGHTIRINEDFTARLTMAREKNHLIDTLYKTTGEHAAARKGAEEASRIKSQFLANMSHELRTPLNAILGFAEVMKNQILGPIDNPKYRSYLDDIHSSGLHLLGLINDVLDLSKIEAGQYSPDDVEVDIDELADDCIRLIDIRAVAYDIRLEKRFVTPPPMVRADQRAMRQIWLNLIANAVKFSGKGAAVTLSADYLPDGSFYIGVEDDGPGIAEHEVNSVLNTFGQGTEGKARPGEVPDWALLLCRACLVPMVALSSWRVSLARARVFGRSFRANVSSRQINGRRPANARKLTKVSSLRHKKTAMPRHRGFLHLFNEPIRLRLNSGSGDDQHCQTACRS